MKLSEQIKKLEENGIDTSVFNLEVDGVLLTPLDLNKKIIKFNKVLNNKDDIVYQRYLEVVRAYKFGTYNYKKRKIEFGLDACVRNSFVYEDQLWDVVITSIRMLTSNDPYLIGVFNSIYTKDRIFELLNKLNDNVYSYEITPKLKNFMKEYLLSEDTKEELRLLKMFYKCYPESDKSTKHEVWKDMRKAFDSVCALFYAIEHHNLPLTKEDLLYELYELNEKNEIWKAKKILESYMDKYPSKF